MLPRGRFLGLLLGVAALGAAPCRLEIVERGNGWPVPGVELRTVHGERLVSDNAGLIAFDLPELMGRETWAEVHGHGYGVKKDGFGYAGVRFVPRPGATVRIEVDPTTFPAIAEHHEKVVAALEAVGYRYVTLDLAGFRSGNLNWALRGDSP